MKPLILGLAITLMAAASASAADLPAPEAVYGSRPNNLADIPAGWAVDNPIQLQVLFNLRFAPNSPEADAFLAEYARFEASLPYGGRTTISRVVAPATFHYAGQLTFLNWAAYQAYETSQVFRDWYHAVWKPAVTETAEQFTVLDARASGASK